MSKSVIIDIEKVKRFAMAKVWTFAELARQSKLSDATLYSLQNGRRKASLMTVQKIALALGVEPSEIVKEEQE